MRELDFMDLGSMHMLNSTVPPVWGNLSKLRTIHLDNNNGLYGPLPKEWSSMTAMENFILHRSNVTVSRSHF